MIVYIYYSESASGLDEAFLGFQQYPQAGAGNVFERRKVENMRVSDSIHKGLRLFTLGGIKTPAIDYFPVISEIDLKHLLLLLLRGGFPEALWPLRKCHRTLSVCVVVMQRVDHFVDQVQAEPSGRAVFDRGLNIHLAS